jgi:transposase
MSKILYNDLEQSILLKNSNVIRVSDRTISYHTDFKVKAVQEYLTGKTPNQIFIQNDFNLELIGHDKPKGCLRRWRAIYKEFGEPGLRDEKRGSGSTGRPSGKNLSIDEKLKKAEARINFLEAELDFLKKLKQIEGRR